MACDICGRDKPTTFHHLIPRTLHSNKWFRKRYDYEFMKSHGIDVCYDCSHALHTFWDEKTLGREYNTLEKILADPKIQRHIEYARKKK